MGKTTVARQFGEFGAKVFSADESVRALYLEPDVQKAITDALPEVVGPNGTIQMEALKELAFTSDRVIGVLENILHPRVRRDEENFLAAQRKVGAKLVVLDIPLLFETGSDKFCNHTVVVTAPYEVQKQRVMERSGMTEARFKSILERQLPDGVKRHRADFVIDTEGGLVASKQQVEGIVERVCGK